MVGKVVVKTAFVIVVTGKDPVSAGAENTEILSPEGRIVVPLIVSMLKGF